MSENLQSPPPPGGSALQRFLDAKHGDYPRALAEIQSGRKRSHWMWYIFPQLAGLGSSSTAQFYAIKDLEEARAFLQHPTLGPRLIEITTALLAVEGEPPSRSSATPMSSNCVPAPPCSPESPNRTPSLPASSTSITMANSTPKPCVSCARRSVKLNGTTFPRGTRPLPLACGLCASFPVVPPTIEVVNRNVSEVGQVRATHAQESFAFWASAPAACSAWR